MWTGNCQIQHAGIEPGGRAQLGLKAEDGTFGWDWFLSKKGLDREILATALAAISSNKLVFCEMNATAAWSEVSRCLLVK